MPKSKPPYPAAFKQQIVELAMAGRTPAELSREFGISAQSVTAWVAQAAANAGKPARTTASGRLRAPQVTVHAPASGRKLARKRTVAIARTRSEAVAAAATARPPLQV